MSLKITKLKNILNKEFKVFMSKYKDNSIPWGEEYPGHIYFKPFIEEVGTPEKIGIIKDEIVLKKPVLVVKRILAYSLAERLMKKADKRQLLPFFTEVLLTSKFKKGFGPNTLHIGDYLTLVEVKDIDIGIELTFVSNADCCVLAPINLTV